jgi:hypothetical protein
MKMAKHVQIPVSAAERTSDGKYMQMEAISGQLQFPGDCLYCGASGVVDGVLEINIRVSPFGSEPLWTHQARVCYCQTHAKQLKVISYFLIALGIATGLLVLIPNAVQIFEGGAALVYGSTDSSWMAVLAGILYLVAAPVLIGIFAAAGVKILLGIFLPPFRYYRIPASLGVKLKLLRPNKKQGRPVHLLDLKFASEKVAGEFEALNPINSALVAKADKIIEASAEAKKTRKQEMRSALKASRIDQRVDQQVKIAQDPGRMTSSRTQAIAGLSLVDHPRANQQIILALADDSRDIACAAAIAMKRRGFPEGAEPLIEAIRRPGEEFATLRILSIKALMNIAPEKAADSLLERLADQENENFQVLREASYGLGELREARAIDPLKSLLQHKKEKVRLAAQNALRMIEEPSEAD